MIVPAKLRLHPASIRPKFGDVPVGWAPGWTGQPNEHQPGTPTPRGSTRHDGRRLRAAEAGRRGAGLPRQDRMRDCLRQGRRGRFRPPPGLPPLRSVASPGTAGRPPGTEGSGARLPARFRRPVRHHLRELQKDFATWVRFVRLMTWNVPVEAAAELCGGVTRRPHSVAPPRLYATVRGYQDRIVLRGAAYWIDEDHVNDTDLSRVRAGPQARPVEGEAVHSHRHRRVKTPVAFVCWARKAVDQEDKEAALRSHLAESSTVVRQGARPQRRHRRQGGAPRRPTRRTRATRPPRGHGDGEQLGLVAEALPLAIHGHGPGEPQSHLDWFVYCSACARRRTGEETARWFAI